MARTSSSNGLQLGSRDVTRIVVVLIGITAIAASFLTPWWTRGFTFDFSSEGFAFDGEEGQRPAELAGVEGAYWSYGPFSTPGGAMFSVDGYREFAAAALGVVILLASLFISAHLWLRWGMNTGRIETNHDLPVRFAIAAFWLGLAGILIAAFLLPVAGPNAGMLYGSEDAAVDEFGALETTRFANVGFFLGIVGFVAYPAWLWVDASATRAVATTGTTTRSRAAADAY